MYLTYSKYVEMGGVLDEAAFKLWSRRAERKLNNFTFNRLKWFFAPYDADDKLLSDKHHDPHHKPHHKPHDHNRPDHESPPDGDMPEKPDCTLSPEEESELGSQLLEIEENATYEPYNPIKEAAEEVMFDFIELMSSDNANSELTSYSNGVESFHFNTDKRLDPELYAIAVEAFPIEIISGVVHEPHHHCHPLGKFQTLGGCHEHHCYK